MLKKYYWKKLEQIKIKALCNRKAINFEQIYKVVKPILEEVKKYGDSAVEKYTKRFDKVDFKRLGSTSSGNFTLTEKEIAAACKRIPSNIQKAFYIAAKNIQKFHKLQIPKKIRKEVMPGVVCFREARAIEKVGLYIPGGTAILPSTVLMLAIPAKIAGCEDIIMCTPPGENGFVSDIVLFAAKLAGITKIFKIGGAQAVSAMAYGTESIPKVDKIFGPGNQYVTAAKMLVNLDGTAIDLPAGPTEVLVIADKNSRSDFVAADLLSQAEHGIDSCAILVCTDEKKTDEILREINRQLTDLPRKETAKRALKNSFALIVSDIKQAFDFANEYAPEHLILNMVNAEKYVSFVRNAGSVFLGPYSCESAGDYASGTNHVLPTYGYAKAYGGVAVESFLKQITFQKITREGAKNLGPTIATMAEQESLEGHKKAMEIRYKLTAKI